MEKARDGLIGLLANEAGMAREGSEKKHGSCDEDCARIPPGKGPGGFVSRHVMELWSRGSADEPIGYNSGFTATILNSVRAQVLDRV